MILLFVLFLIRTSLQGTLTPIGTNPVTHTKSNKGEFADYTFTFAPESVIPSGGTIEIIFPSQFKSGLGVVYNSSNFCSYSCTVTGHLVTMTVQADLLNGVCK